MAGCNRDKGRPGGLTGTDLKWIGIFTMTLNHGGIALAPLLGQKTFWWLNQAGRPAFIIFSFLLAEGFVHTGSRSKYLKRLLLLAVLSEIPYDLAIFGQPVYLAQQNVFWTLSMGLGVLWLYEKAKWIAPQEMVLAGATAAGCGAAWLFRTDYDVMGILLIVWFYWARDSRGKQLAGALAIFLVFVGMDVFAATCLSLIFLGLYNGQRGKNTHPGFFYWYYPAHLMIFALAGWKLT